MAQGTCSVEGCGKLRHARGWCAMHYARWQKHGDLSPRNPGKEPIPVIQRIYARSVVQPSGCIEWMGGRNGSGYGIIGVGSVIDGSRTMARIHRVAYQALVGQIPDGLELDHLCRNRACWRVEHLEPVTGRVNKMRGISPPAVNSAKTHCAAGHPFDAENTYRTADGWRRCRACGAAHARALRVLARPHERVDIR